MRRNLIGLILAGGQARRFGGKKALAHLEGRPLALWVKEALEPFCEEIWLSLREPDQPEALLGPHFKRIFFDPLPGAGPLAGLLAALKGLSPEAALLVAPCDQPLIQPTLLQGLRATFEKDPAPAVVFLGTKGYEPFPGIYCGDLVKDLENYLEAGGRSVRKWLSGLSPEKLLGIPPEKWYAWDPEGWSFLNINYQEDLKRIEALLREKRPPLSSA
ncbi:molybdenum cofactor guanylyltransferase [Thermosulfurimonas marina]|uniref:Probable molybdenum cofactor guanylyltransferase n=1 Tax=Thermosulfurimonas marina TaxID=2047767 RepID=A0A6H1WRM6_9BACT|nr:molybdenum cofactor guanylyltransferase [Thermosulfurimonas marina]QJA05842.1 molybdenum cofactor guanylyltransferase [Thermosulfurimonas marina]